MSEIKIGKPYSVKQLKEMFGEDFYKNRMPRAAISTKPKITHFSQFDEHTKKVYLTILDEVKKTNRAAPNSKVYATGSRVSGTWKTKEEAEKIAEDTGHPVKYSDYDYWTDAPNKPNILRLCDLTGEKIDCVRSSILLEVIPEEK